MFQQLLRNPRLLIVSVIALGALGGAAHWWSSTYTPKAEEVVELNDRLTDIREANRRTRESMSRIDASSARRAITAYDKQAGNLAALVPPDTAARPLMMIVPTTANEFGVSVSGLTPTQPRSVSPYTSDGVQMTVRGRYHDVGAFLTRLLTLERITHIRDARLRVVTGPGGQPLEISPGVYHVDVSFILHGFMDPSRPAPNPAGMTSRNTPSSRPSANRRPSRSSPDEEGGE
jgi:Tfp pilus assembly protein PilO